MRGGAVGQIVSNFVDAVGCPNCCYWLNREENGAVVEMMIEEDPVRSLHAMHQTHLIVCGVLLLASSRN